MATLYITEQGSYLKKSGTRLIVEKDGTELLHVPCIKIDTVFIYGYVQVSTQALTELLGNGIELAFFSMDGRLKGQLTPPKAKNVILRFKQYQLSQEQAFRLKLAKQFVMGKLKNCLSVVRHYKYNHPQLDISYERIVLKNAIKRIDSIETLETLRGIEGIAAVSYFSALEKMLPAELGFKQRLRRPPKDPVNALLSFGYVIITNELHSLLDGMGFDPYIGFYHALDYGRPSQALDLVEEFRPAIVDRFVMYLFNNRIFNNDDFFTANNGGVYLKPEPKKRFFREYEAMMNKPFRWDAIKQETSFRKVFQHQAQRMARAITTGEEYQPFLL